MSKIIRERPEDGSIIVEEPGEKIAIFPFFGNSSAKIPGIGNTAIVLSVAEGQKLLLELTEWDLRN